MRSRLKPAICVVGCGNFGRLLLETLAPYCDIVGFDIDPNSDGVLVPTPSAIAKADIIILAVPVQELEKVLPPIAPHLTSAHIVIDVCSVKMRAVRTMVTLLPQCCEILGTHPLFGPQSAADGVAGSRLAYVPVRGTRYRRILAFLRLRLGLEIIRTTAEQHDRDMAYVQGLTHMIARVVGRINAPETRLSTKTYQHMHAICALVGDDTETLFESIMCENPFAAEVFDTFTSMFHHLRQTVEGFRADGSVAQAVRLL